MPTTQPSSTVRGAMRRREREITDRAEIDAILDAGRVMRLALVDGDRPFMVPVFYAYDGHALYFHSAQKGSKIEILERNPNVCIEVGLDHGVIEDDKACDFEARHRTVIAHRRLVPPSAHLIERPANLAASRAQSSGCGGMMHPLYSAISVPFEVRLAA